MQNAVTQQTNSRRRVVQALDRAANFIGFSAVDLARQSQIAEINFIATARQAHRQRPNLHSLGAQKRNHARRFTAIFVAVGNQQDFPLAPLADLGNSGLQRGLNVGFVAVEARTKFAGWNPLTRQ